jgi:hypothetical protein
MYSVLSKRISEGDKRWRTLREIADKLALAGFVTGTGKPYAAAAVAKMIEA